MSRKEFFLMGLLLGMTVVGFCWGMWQVDSNLQRQIAFELRSQAER